MAEQEWKWKSLSSKAVVGWLWSSLYTNGALESLYFFLPNWVLKLIFWLVSDHSKISFIYVLHIDFYYESATVTFPEKSSTFWSINNYFLFLNKLGYSMFLFRAIVNCICFWFCVCSDNIICIIFKFWSTMGKY